MRAIVSFIEIICYCLMIKEAANILKDKNLLEDFPEKTYQFGYIRTKENKLQFNFNFFVDDSIIENVAKYLNDKNYTNIVIVARSEKEPFTNAFPKPNKLEQFVDLIDTNTNLFYQEPWPGVVPNFELDDNSCVVRFGFDEGLSLNTKNVNKNYPIQDTREEIVPCLFTNLNIIPLC